MKNTPADATLAWISPAQANDMVYDVREDGCEDLGFALLRPRAKGAPNTVAALLAAKAAPMKPTVTSWTTRCGLPTTARDVRLVLAPGVADPASIAGLVVDYDAATQPRQKLLAAVLTMKFDPDTPLHDNVDMVTTFAIIQIARGRRVSSIVVTHTPAEGLSDAPSHCHVVVLARVHRPGIGFGALHADLTDGSHAMWVEQWRHFQRAWHRQLES